MITHLLAPIALALALAAQAPTPDTHKGWMNDATDAQEDLRAALAAKSPAASTAAAEKLRVLMEQTERYWADRHAADIVTLAQQAKALAGRVATESKAGKFDRAGAAFARLNTTCNTCHDLHPEKR